MRGEGYVLVAVGKEKYFKMAALAAISIRHYDRVRGICLATNEPNALPDDFDTSLFTDIVRLPSGENLRGTEFHLFIDQYSPYERTLYVDADCLLCSSDIDSIWDELRSYSVTFPGRKLTDGVWRVDISSVMSRYGISYVVQLNGGVFYFDRSSKSTEFFSTAQRIFVTEREKASVKHHSGGGFANEPIWGITMALTESPIFPLSRQLNVSTLRTEVWTLHSDGKVGLVKDGATWFPVFCHFLGLGGAKCPNELYSALNGYLLPAKCLP